MEMGRLTRDGTAEPVSQVFSEKKKVFVFKNELFFEDPEDVKSRSTRPPERYIYWVCANERACSWEHFDILVEAIDQLPTPFQQK